MPPRRTGAIIAGGAAVRYGGRPKGLERVGGVRIIDRVAAALQDATDDLLLIANDPSAPEWLPGVRVVSDVLRNAGSVAGIHSALVHAGTPVVTVAWDMPFVPASLLRALAQLGADADAAVPESDSRRGLEPLCAYYDSACIAAIEDSVGRGDRRVVGFFDQVRVERMPIDDVARFGDPRHLFLNVNTPEELGVAEGLASSTAAEHHRT